MAHPFRIYNTLSRNIEDFEPLEPGKVGLYVCGMTVYDDCHVGHARAMMVFDSFVRYLRSRSWEVTFVRNFTDVDDKIIARAADRGEDPAVLAQRFIDRFAVDMEGLRLDRPTHEPRVSTSIGDIQALIAALIERGHAYAADGSVWFSVDSCDTYGKLSGQRTDKLEASADADSGKRSGLDFAVWKAHKPGEPSWDSPWGPGRPGWHIECSAMAQATIGATIDIHGGGLDLVFPHHENEIAQSECGTGKPFARYWMHNGMLEVADGRKMGKSEGNAFGISEVLATYPAEAVRLYYLQSHYRSPIPWNASSLDEALAMLARLYEAREVAAHMGGEEPVGQVVEGLGADAQTVVTLADAFEESFQGYLAEDFNTSAALGLAFELARAINRFSNHKKAKKRGGPVVAKALDALALIPGALGLLTNTGADFDAAVKDKRLPALGLTVDGVEALLAERIDARTAKDWARADEIRDELEGVGIAIMDGPAGSTWRIRLS